METKYVYKQSEFGEYRLWTVGYFDPQGNWYTESDHDNTEDAAKRVNYLNGGSGLSEALYKIAGENYDDDDKKRHLRSTIDRMKCIANEALGL